MHNNQPIEIDLRALAQARSEAFDGLHLWNIECLEVWVTAAPDQQGAMQEYAAFAGMPVEDVADLDWDEFCQEEAAQFFVWQEKEDDDALVTLDAALVTYLQSGGKIPGLLVEDQ